MKPIRILAGLWVGSLATGSLAFAAYLVKQQAERSELPGNYFIAGLLAFGAMSLLASVLLAWKTP